MKRFLTLLMVTIVSCTIVNAEQTRTLKLVTPQMSQKMYRTIKAYPNITQLMYHLLDATSTLDGELKIEAIAEHPDSAKNALNKLCSFLDNQGGDDYLDANLLQVFHFTARETQLARSIYSDYRDEQLAIQAEQELQEEQNLLKRWGMYGADVFDFNSKDENLLRPRIDAHIENAIAYIDSITANSTLSSSNDIATIQFTIVGPRRIEDFKSTGRFGNVFNSNSFVPAVSAHYHFEQLDTIVSVPCRITFSLNDKAETISDLDIQIKYDRKKNIWKISSYNSNKEISEDDLHIINRFLESLPIDDPLRNKKHSLTVEICKHWIESNNPKYPIKFKLTNICRIRDVLENKSGLQRYGEAHWNW